MIPRLNPKSRAVSIMEINMNIKERIKELNVPSLFTSFGRPVSTKEDFEALKPDILDLFQREEYGYMPKAPDSVRVEVIDEKKQFFAGKGKNAHYRLYATYEGRELSFPFSAATPNYTGSKIPVFVNIAFDPTPNFRQPTTEIIDRGYAVFTVCYKDCTSDDGDFENGVAKILGMDRSDPHATGKIAMWSWCVSRVIDYIYTLDIFDHDKLAVIGHSRLGKTTLLTAAFDERVKFACVNDSGNSGDALSRGTAGETIADITKRFPYWFCPAYQKYAGNEDSLPFDQHYLLSAVAPRALVIGTAKDDLWADPKNEFLALTLTNDVYKLYGKVGLIHPEEIPEAPFKLQEGSISFHTRLGNHCLSREDWNNYMDFIDKF